MLSYHQGLPPTILGMETGMQDSRTAAQERSHVGHPPPRTLGNQAVQSIHTDQPMATSDASASETEGAYIAGWIADTISSPTAEHFELQSLYAGGRDCCN